MNSYLKKIVDIKELEERFKVIDKLLNEKIININLLEDYYINIAGIDTIMFVKRYHDKVNIKIFGDAVIESESSLCIYCFALEIEGANINRLENALINTKDFSRMCYFALVSPKANISKLEEAIVQSRDAEYIYYFARDIQSTNIIRLEEALLKTQSYRFTHHYLRDIKGIDIDSFDYITEVSHEEVIDINTINRIVSLYNKPKVKTKQKLTY